MGRSEDKTAPLSITRRPSKYNHGFGTGLHLGGAVRRPLAQSGGRLDYPRLSGRFLKRPGVSKAAKARRERLATLHFAARSERTHRANVHERSTRCSSARSRPPSSSPPPTRAGSAAQRRSRWSCIPGSRTWGTTCRGRTTVTGTAQRAANPEVRVLDREALPPTRPAEGPSETARVAAEAPRKTS